MLRYQKFNIAFTVLIIALTISDIFLHIHLLAYGGIILAFIGLLAWGSSDIRSGWYVKTYCKGDMQKRSLSLTFDDGPDKIVTPALLDLLRNEDIKAAFFCIGKKAEQNPDLLAQIDKDGHVIGGHSYSHHFFFDLFISDRMLNEMQRSEDIVFKITGKRMRLFRPPYGVTNPLLAKALEQKNYHVIGWSLRSKDTVIKNEEKLFEKVAKKVKPGDVILFHDTQNHMVNVLGKFIKFAKENGFTFERPDKHLGIEPYG
ncbi:MAG: polysaccharide deacetylase family protein [Bacteroidales bacterium]|jgi:peptidoglycan/xylan/chitin deacetylase (PgdA/CDA1 family)|nr:polysaccharide deacetylase family protein [Bacteroidales bacterium]